VSSAVPRRLRAFTLIEVLVALVIVAVGMAAVMKAVSSSADTVFFMRDKTFAQWVALNQLATLRLSGQVPAVGTTEGDVDFAGRTWHWHQEVVSSEVPGIERIDVSVRPKDVKGDDDSGWFTTVSGLYGDAVAAPRGDTPDWGSQLLAPGSASPVAPGTLGSAAPAPGSAGSIAAPVAPNPANTGSPDSGLSGSGLSGSGLSGNGQSGLDNPPPPPPPDQPQDPGNQ
jgi:general secretion pathway protein I